jgi:hypothetical protein
MEVTVLTAGSDCLSNCASALIAENFLHVDHLPLRSELKLHDSSGSSY